MSDRTMISLSRLEASEVLAEVTDRADNIKAQLNDLNGRLTEIADNFEWQSFTPNQRVSLSKLHTTIRQVSDLLSSYV